MIVVVTGTGDYGSIGCDDHGDTCVGDGTGSNGGMCCGSGGDSARRRW